MYAVAVDLCFAETGTPVDMIKFLCYEIQGYFKATVLLMSGMIFDQCSDERIVDDKIMIIKSDADSDGSGLDHAIVDSGRSLIQFGNIP